MFAIKSRHQTDGGWSETGGSFFEQRQLLAAGHRREQRRCLRSLGTLMKRATMTCAARVLEQRRRQSRARGGKTAVSTKRVRRSRYDKDGALWIAWEKSGQTWGKDWAHTTAPMASAFIAIGRSSDRAQRRPVDAADRRHHRSASRRTSTWRQEGQARGTDASAPPPRSVRSNADGFNLRHSSSRLNAEARPANTLKRLAPKPSTISAVSFAMQMVAWCLVRSRLNSFRGLSAPHG